MRAHGPRSALCGQLSLEALLLGAIALSLILIATLAISRLQAGQADLFSRRTLQIELENLGQYADEICVLGAGNARTVGLGPAVLQLQSEGKTLTVRQGNWTSSRDIICPAQIDSPGPFGSNAYLWYEPQSDGGPGVVISPAPPT